MTTAKRPPTSADVARKAGVSRATVSYVLNGLSNSRISEDTRASVQAAADALGYIPHAMARSLRKGHSNTVLIPQSSYPLGPTLTTFYQDLSTHLRKLGYTTLVHLDPAIHGLEAARTWASLRPAGVLVLESRVTPQSMKLLSTSGVQGVVLIAHQPSTLGPTLLADHSELGACAAAYLFERGHRHVAVQLPRDPDLLFLGRERARGVQRVGATHHIIIEPFDLAFDESEASQFAVQLRQARRKKKKVPTAIVAFNDLYALLLMRALQNVGLAVPDDIAVIGIDNLEVGGLSRPGLTSVQPMTSQPLEAFVSFFDKLMRGKKTDTTLVPMFSPSLVARESA